MAEEFISTLRWNMAQMSKVQFFSSFEELYDHKDDNYYYQDCENIQTLPITSLMIVRHVATSFSHDYKTILTMKPMSVI